jgi:hypothetical protein
MADAVVQENKEEVGGEEEGGGLGGGGMGVKGNDSDEGRK